MKKYLFTNIAFVMLLNLAACGTAPAEEATPKSAILSELLGAVEVKQAGEDDFTAAAPGFVLNENGQVQTGDDGKARLDLSTGTIVRVAPSSLFTLISNTPEGDGLSTKGNIDIGQIWIILSGGEMDVETPSGEASVRGSRLGVQTNADGGVRVTCFEGDCSFQNNTGTYAIPPGSVLECSGPDDVPTITPMTADDIAEWLEIDSGAAAFIPALTAAAVTPTIEATASPTPTPSPSPTPSPLPTFTVLTGIVTADSLSCRYGPGANYLYQYGLSKNNEVQVLGRADTTVGTWLYVKYSTTLKPCWVNARFIELSGDLAGLESVYPEKAPLVQFDHTKFPPPENVSATRTGDQVAIHWDGYELALGDRESAESPIFLVEVWTCVDGKIVFTPLGAFTESAVVTDEAGCSEPSHGQVYIAHKDGYIGPIEIPWPPFPDP